MVTFAAKVFESISLDSTTSIFGFYFKVAGFSIFLIVFYFFSGVFSESFSSLEFLAFVFFDCYGTSSWVTSILLLDYTVSKTLVLSFDLIVEVFIGLKGTNGLAEVWSVTLF